MISPDTTEAPWVPPEVQKAPPPWSPPEAQKLAKEAPVSANPPADTEPDFQSLYGGLEGLDGRLKPEQAKSFANLDRVNGESIPDARARAINQAYIGKQLPDLTPEYIRNHWQTIAPQFMAKRFQIDDPTMGETARYAKIADHLQKTAFLGKPEWQDAPAPHKFQSIQDEFGFNAAKVEKDATTPFGKLPEAPKDLPDVWMGTGMGIYNPAVVGGVWNSVIKPFVEGVESPLGVATLGAGMALKGASASYQAAKYALATLEGGFAAMMGKTAIQQTPEMWKVLNDPKATTQEKVQAVGSVVLSAVMAVTSAFGAASEVRPDLPAKIKGKTVEEAAEVLHKEAEKEKIPEHAALISEAANHLEELAQTDHPPVAPENVPTAEPTMVDAPGRMAEAPQGPLPQIEPPSTNPAELQETSLKNAVSDMEREEYGLDDVTPSEKREMAPRWQEAAETLKRDPEAGARLAQKLQADPNIGLSDTQSALLLRHKVGLENALNEARDIANDQEASPELRQEATRQMDDLSKQLGTFMDAVHRRGSEWGREGRWRQAMAKEDFTFAAQEQLLKATKGRDLNNLERGKLNKQIDELKAKQAEMEKHLQTLREAKGPEAGVAQAVKDMQGPPAKARFARSSAIGVRLSRSAQEARARLSARLASPQAMAFLDPKIIKDVATVAADHIYSTGLDFAKWSDRMIREFGPEIQGALKDIWKEAVPIFHQESREGVLEGLKAQMEAGKAPNINKAATDLAKGFISEGVKGRDAIVDAVKGELNKALPDLTRRQAMDAISGYGDFKPLTHGEIVDQLRDVKGQLQQLAKLEDIAAGLEPKKTGVERAEPSIEQIGLKQKVDAALKEAGFRISRELTDEQRLNQAKNRLTARKLDLEQRIRDEDFESVAKRQPVKLDEQGLKLKSEVERLKQEFAMAREAAAEAAQPKSVKVMKQVSGAARAGALSGINTLGKLFGFTVAKLAETPATEALGAIIRKTPGFREIAAKANLEAGAEAKAIGRFYAKFATDGMREAGTTLTTGKGTLKAELGRPMETGRPRRWYDFPGLLHEIEKAPLGTADFNLRLTKLEAWADANGMDLNDGMVQASLRKEAYDYSQRAKLQEANSLAEAISGYVDRAMKEDPKTKKVDAQKAALATFLQTFVTKGIVKVPLNHIKQALLESGPIGLARGIEASIRAKVHGVKGLTESEANTIMRLMKAGGVGTAMFVWGAIDATKKPEDRAFGGFYNPGEKRDQKDAKFGRIRVGGFNLVLPAPVLMQAQLGSTFTRAFASKIRKGADKANAVLSAGLASILSLAYTAPYVNPIGRAVESSQRGEPERIAWDMIAGLVPELSANIAGYIDDKSRKAKNVKEAVELRLPGLRENVGETNAQKMKDRQAPRKRNINHTNRE